MEELLADCYKHNRPSESVCFSNYGDRPTACMTDKSR